MNSFVTNIGKTKNGIVYYDSDAETFLNFKDSNMEIINPEIILKGCFNEGETGNDGDASTILIDVNEIIKQLGENAIANVSVNENVVIIYFETGGII